MKRRGAIALLILGILAIVASMAGLMMVSIGNEVKLVRLQETQVQNQQIEIARELLRERDGGELELPAELK
jgi:hypothetical protein